jgi:glucose-6-phosphate 1-dehydrogenase
MEEPISLNADDLRAEKEKVLAAVELLDDLSTHSAAGSSLEAGRAASGFSGTWTKRGHSG